MSTSVSGSERLHGAFLHEALLYAGAEGFLRSTVPFILDGVDTGEPVLVVVSADKIDMLRAALGHAAAKVDFADMADVGNNPARIIPAWRRFLDERGEPGRPARGIGEPIYPERDTHELAECERHEALLNLACADDAAFWLLCPYDVTALSPAVIAGAHRSHPHILEASGRRPSGDYELPRPTFDAPIPPPPADATAIRFDIADELDALRRFVSRQAVEFGLDNDRVCDLVVAVNELVTNSLRYGGGSGTLRMWAADHRVLCEVEDGGQIRDALVGRVLPNADGQTGRGLWLVNQLCDLAQVRTSEAGTTVRVHMARR